MYHSCNGSCHSNYFLEPGISRMIPCPAIFKLTDRSFSGSMGNWTFRN